jgi:modulator of FtsH protease
MADFQTVYASGAVATSSEARNKVLRNTYALLALSLVPTVLGAWLALALGLDKTMLASPGLTMIVFFVGAFGFIFGIERNKESSTGVFMLLGFTFFMGIMLSRMLGFVLGMSNGVSLIMMSLGGTGAIFAAMATLGTVIKRDLSGLGKFLFIGALIVMVGGIISVFFPMPAMMMALMFMCLAIFSLFMMYDVNRIVTGGETNYISATLALYLDIYNVFQSLLAILGIFGGNRD